MSKAPTQNIIQTIEMTTAIDELFKNTMRLVDSSELEDFLLRIFGLPTYTMFGLLL